MAGRAALALVTFGGLGFSPVAPGTVASVAAFGLHLAALACGGGGFSTCAAVAFLAAALGVALGAWAQGRFGREDPPAFVLDEVAGYFTAAALLVPTAWGGITALVLFRFFDILKPFPIRTIERAPGGWGIVGDDVAAGLAAGLAGRIGWALLT